MVSMLKLCGLLIVFAVVVLANPLIEQNTKGQLDDVMLKQEPEPGAGGASPGVEARPTTPAPSTEEKSQSTVMLKQDPEPGAGGAGTEPTTTTPAPSKGADNRSTLTTPSMLLSFVSVLPMIIIKLSGTY